MTQNLQRMAATEFVTRVREMESAGTFGAAVKNKVKPMLAFNIYDGQNRPSSQYSPCSHNQEPGNCLCYNISGHW